MAGSAARSLRPQTTPGRLRGFSLLLLAATFLLWITATILLQGLHGTATSVRNAAVPAVLDVIEAHAALSDADRAAWWSFRSGQAQLTGPGQEYQDDITTADQDLERLAALAPSGSEAGQQLQTVSGQLVNYQALVEQADGAYRVDIALGAASGHDLGYAYLTYASSAMRDPQGGLIANVSRLGAADQRALQRQLTSPWTDPALLLALAGAGLVALGSIAAAQGFLLRRFRRVISPPLLVAAALVCGLLAWVAVVALPADGAFAAARAQALPALTGVWHAQIRAVDSEAASLRENSGGKASAAAAGGLDVTRTQHARSSLEADLAAAESTGGLPAGIPVTAAVIAGLGFLAVKPRLDEYRG